MTMPWDRDCWDELPDPRPEEDEPFLPDDFRFTADLLRRHSRLADPALFRAVCSNNLNIILAALDQAGAE